MRAAGLLRSTGRSGEGLPFGSGDCGPAGGPVPVVAEQRKNRRWLASRSRVHPIYFTNNGTFRSLFCPIIMGPQTKPEVKKASQIRLD
jgi:hypothetical protein